MTIQIYTVGVKIYNSWDVLAESAEQAEQKIRDLTNDEILSDCDFNISYVDLDLE
jgi:hypothetical protein